MPRRPKYLTDEQALIAGCLAAPTDYAPWAALTDYYADHGPAGASETLAALVPGLVELPRLPHVWRGFARAVTHRPAFATILAETADALACAARLAAQRLIPEPCACGRPARAEWRACGECGAG
jgi:hypothetical protein